MKESEQMYLQQCRQCIEKRVGWGSPEQWTNQDFIRLSELILHETGISLSTTTLKRIWGKVKYDSVPQLTTLNVLARFASYSDWRSFKKDHLPPSLSAVQKSKVEHGNSIPLTKSFYPSSNPSSNTYQERKVIVRSFWIILLLLVGGTGLLGLIFSVQTHNSAAILDAEDFSLSATVVTSGLPNTVIFDYDASAAPTDSIYLEQSSDPEQRTRLSRQGHRHAEMYYYPGAYRARLRVNDTMVSEQAFMLKTNGWLAMVERDPMPLYFEENIIRQGVLGLTEEELESKQIDLHHDTPWVSYHHVQDFGGLYNDDFIMETAVKSIFSQGEAVCQDSSVTIMYHDAPPFIIPLAIPGCLAKLDKVLKEQKMEEGVNLLAFGADFSDWVPIRCEAKDQHLRLFINHQLAYQGELPQRSSKIIGLAYRFHGSGLVNYVSLSQADGKEIYCEDFSG